MRNFSLREKQSVITVLREPPTKKKEFPWQKYAFIVIILLLVIFMVYRAVSTLWIIHANGQIEVAKQTVHFANDIDIKEFFVNEGQQVFKGDTLFRYAPVVEDIVSTSITDYDRPEEWIEREKIDLRSKIAEKSFLIEQVRGQIQNTSQLADMKKEMILLGSVNDKNEYEYLRLDIKKLELQLASLQKEKAYMQNLVNSLQAKENTTKQVTTNTRKTTEVNTFFISPMDGIIGQINFNANEVCFRREEVLTIHKVDDMKIKVYFDPSEMKYLDQGDEVEITFPDGSSSKGFIENFHVATYALPEEFQKKYEPTERNIVANVLLTDNKDVYKLMNFYKMNVRISKPRFNLFT